MDKHLFFYHKSSQILKKGFREVVGSLLMEVFKFTVHSLEQPLLITPVLRKKLDYRPPEIVLNISYSTIL